MLLQYLNSPSTHTLNKTLPLNIIKVVGVY